jgi:4-amino-4-deoxy-L-arabinose transferase-like glycosyltransferase
VRTTSAALALTLLVAGLAVPSHVWLAMLGAATTRHELMQGAMLLRFALCMVGAYGLIGWRLGFWKTWNPDAVALPPAPRAAAIIFAAIAVGAIVLRVVRLGEGLWIDEVVTLVSYARQPFGQILTTYDSQNQHLLYSLMAHASFLLFGESAWALRLPAVLFGVAGVWALYRLAREVSDIREALLSAAVLAFSYQHVWFSQSARGYTGLLMWSLVSTSLLLRGLRGGGSRLWLLYAASAALGVLTHQTMLFVVIGQFVVYGYWYGVRGTHRDRLDRWWIPLCGGFVPAALLTITGYALVLPQFGEVASTDVSNVAAWLSPLWTIRELIGGMHLGPTFGAGAIAAVIILLLGVRSYARTEPAIPILLIVPAAVGVSVMLAFRHPVWPRFFFFATGFGILVVVRGIGELGAWIARAVGRPAAAGRLATTMTLLAIAVTGMSLKYVYLPKQDFLGARNFVNASRRPGDAVVTVGVATIPFGMYFSDGWQSAATAGEVDELRRTNHRTWLLYTLPVEMASAHADVLKLLDSEFTLIRRFDGTLNGGTIFVYRADRPEVEAAAASLPGRPAGRPRRPPHQF